MFKKIETIHILIFFIIYIAIGIFVVLYMANKDNDILKNKLLIASFILMYPILIFIFLLYVIFLII